MRHRLEFAGKKCIRMMLLLLGVSLAAFLLMAASPLDPLQTNVGQVALGSMSPEQVARLEDYWGTNTPLPERYLGWLADAVRDSLLAEEQSENAPHFHAAPIHPEPIELGFDRSWLYIGPDGWQSLLLVEGNVVASVEGPADFTDPAVLDMVRARLELEKSPDPAPEARPVGMSAPVKQAQGVEGFHA